MRRGVEVYLDGGPHGGSTVRVNHPSVEIVSVDGDDVRRISRYERTHARRDHPLSGSLVVFAHVGTWEQPLPAPAERIVARLYGKNAT